MYWVIFNADGVPTSFSGLELPGAEWVEVDHKTLETCRRVNGEWVKRDPEPPVEYTPPEPGPETIDLKAEIAALAERIAELQAVIEAKS